MAGKLAELYVIIGANADKFMKAMDSVQAKGQALTARFRTIEKAAAIMGTALVGAMAAIVYKTAKAEEEMYQLSQRVGVNIKVLSSLKLAAETSGTSLEEMAMGMGILARRMVEGNKIFKEMGLEVRKTNGQFKTVDEMLFEVSDKFAKTSDETKKLSWSQELLGRSGKNTKEFLEMGSEALHNYMKEAERLGIVIDEKTGKAAKEFMDNLKELRAAITGITRVFANELIPIFSTVFKVAVDKLVEARDKMDLAKWAKNTALGVITAFGAIVDVVYGLAMAFQGLKAVVFWVGKGIAEGIGNIIIGYSKFLGLIGKIPGLGVYKGVAAAWESWGKTAIVVADSYGEEVDKLVNQLAGLVEGHEKAKKALQDFKIAIDEGDKSTKKIKKSFQDLLPPAKEIGKALELGVGEYESNIYALEALNADYLDIVKKNTLTEFNYRREGLKKWYEEEKQKLSDVYGRTEEFYKKKLELDEAYQSELKGILKDEKKAWLENLLAVGDAIANLFAQIGALADMSAQNRISALDEEYQKKKEIVDASLMTDEAKYAATEKLDREYERKKRAIQKEAFETQKKISLVTAAINIAEGITKALSAAPPPWNIILAAITAAAGAIQLVTIAAQNFPGAKEGAYIEREGLVRVHPRELISPVPIMKETFREVIHERGERIIQKLANIYQLATIRPQKFPRAQKGAFIEKEMLVPAHAGKFISPVPIMKETIREVIHEGGGGIIGKPANIYLTIYARTLDRDTVDKAAELIYDAMGRQRRRRM
jgi:hypothetical protein